MLKIRLSQIRNKFKFLNIDDPFEATSRKLKEEEQKLFRNFDPDNPPILQNYDKLGEDYKLPSRQLLNYEK